MKKLRPYIFALNLLWSCAGSPANQPESTPGKLLGKWRTDPADSASLQANGNVLMNFEENGHLTYTISDGTRDQIILLTYKVEGNVLITDQPSRPAIVRTNFVVTDSSLELTLDGVTSKYIRDDE